MAVATVTVVTSPTGNCMVGWDVLHDQGERMASTTPGRSLPEGCSGAVAHAGQPMLHTMAKMGLNWFRSPRWTPEAVARPPH